MNRSDKDFIAFFAAFLPIFCHFLVLQGKPVKIVSAPFAIKIDACGKALESLFVQPFDALENSFDMWTRNCA